MTTFAEFFAEDRRLTILKILELAPDYTANDFILQSECARYGHSVSRDRIGTDLAWLAEQDLLRVNHSSGVAVAKLTGRGADIAAGRATVPGVKRPAPGA